MKCSIGTLKQADPSNVLSPMKCVLCFAVSPRISIHYGPTNALVSNKTLIKMSQIKTLKILFFKCVYAAA
jgi:hypothetical protein